MAIEKDLKRLADAAERQNELLHSLITLFSDKPQVVPVALPAPVGMSATPAPVETPAPAPVETPAPAPVETPAPAPVETAPSAPVETAPSAPVETAPSAPVEDKYIDHPKFLIPASTSVSRQSEFPNIQTPEQLNEALVKVFNSIGSREPIDVILKDMGITGVANLPLEKYGELVARVQRIALK